MTEPRTVRRYVTALYNENTGEVRSVDQHGFAPDACQRRARVTFLLHVGEDWKDINTVAIPEDADEDELQAVVKRIVDTYNAELDAEAEAEVAAEMAAVKYAESAHAWGDGSYLVDPCEAGDDLLLGLGEIDGREES